MKYKIIPICEFFETESNGANPSNAVLNIFNKYTLKFKTINHDGNIWVVDMSAGKVSYERKGKNGNKD